MVYQETMPKNMFDNENTLNYYLHFFIVLAFCQKYRTALEIKRLDY